MNKIMSSTSIYNELLKFFSQCKHKKNFELKLKINYNFKLLGGVTRDFNHEVISLAKIADGGSELVLFEFNLPGAKQDIKFISDFLKNADNLGIWGKDLSLLIYDKYQNILVNLIPKYYEVLSILFFLINSHYLSDKDFALDFIYFNDNKEIYSSFNNIKITLKGLNMDTLVDTLKYLVLELIILSAIKYKGKVSVKVKIRPLFNGSKDSNKILLSKFKEYEKLYLRCYRFPEWKHIGYKINKNYDLVNMMESGDNIFTLSNWKNNTKIYIKGLQIYILEYWLKDYVNDRFYKNPESESIPVEDIYLRLDFFRLYRSLELSYSKEEILGFLNNKVNLFYLYIPENYWYRLTHNWDYVSEVSI